MEGNAPSLPPISGFWAVRLASHESPVTVARNEVRTETVLRYLKNPQAYFSEISPLSTTVVEGIHFDVVPSFAFNS